MEAKRVRNYGTKIFQLLMQSTVMLPLSYRIDKVILVQLLYIMIILSYLGSTALGQVVACMPVVQRAQVQSPVGTSFLGEFFWVFPHL